MVHHDVCHSTALILVSGPVEKPEIDGNVDMTGWLVEIEHCL